METTDPAFVLGGPHKGQKFSTKDKDEDEKGNGSCASKYLRDAYLLPLRQAANYGMLVRFPTGDFNGGWWFKQCYTACLTCGPYRSASSRKYPFSDQMIYFPFTRQKVGLKSASMKVKLPASLA